MKIMSFITPVIMKILKKSVEYKNYNKAFNNCPNNGYENHELCQMIGDKTIIHREVLSQKPYSINATNAFLVSALYHYCVKFSRNEIIVLDFGGACGAHYFETKRFLQESVKIYWNVIETQEMVKSAKEHNLENNELRFFDDFSKISVPIDFVYSSGTLQYVPDAYEYLTKLMELKANVILFNRMMFNENDRDFVTIQTSRLSDNGPGKLPDGYVDKDIKYPHTTLSYKKFTEWLEKQYKLEWVFDEHSGMFNINNEKIIGKGLLFVKNI
jgi:putative methyltransferase (TIGR04325 family)